MVCFSINNDKITKQLVIFLRYLRHSEFQNQFNSTNTGNLTLFLDPIPWTCIIIFLILIEGNLRSQREIHFFMESYSRNVLRIIHFQSPADTDVSQVMTLNVFQFHINKSCYIQQPKEDQAFDKYDGEPLSSRRIVECKQRNSV